MVFQNGENSFVVEIKSVENHTWQGVVTWVQGERKEYFRSTLELLTLMESVLPTSA